MNNLTAILLILLAMASFTIEDIFIKYMAHTLSVGAILVVLGFICTVLFAGLAKVNGQSLSAPNAWGRPPMIRAIAEMIAALFFTSSLALVDLSIVASVFQTVPLAITAGAALFLGETVGWRRWSAIAVGFIGVLLIIRPGLSGFEPASLLVLGAVAGVMVRDLISRRIDTEIPSLVIAFQGFGAVIFSGFFLILVMGQELRLPQGIEQPFMALCVIFSMLGYYAIVKATRIGEASVITPFRYTRLVFSMLAGVFIFSERPDTLSLIGASLIILSGLYTLWRERITTS